MLIAVTKRETGISNYLSKSCWCAFSSFLSSLSRKTTHTFLLSARQISSDETAEDYEKCAPDTR